MSTATTPTASPTVPVYLSNATFQLGKLSVKQYHQMITTGILPEGEPIELLEGYMVLKMSRGTPHDVSLDVLVEELQKILPAPWYPRTQMAITLADSEPEPDIAVVPGPRRRYGAAHPTPAECRFVIEVSDSSLAIDRHDKTRIYARAGIPVYWVMNVVNKVIEVYTQPSGPTANPAYAKRDDYSVGSAVPVVLDGNTIGNIAVADIMG
jgi:Uma2 family endonuclease